MNCLNSDGDAVGRLERLQVFLARSGVASRRASEKIILAGRVQVNNRRITQLGEKVSPRDTVLVDGLQVIPEKRMHYLALNKPPLYLCSSSDPQGRPLALDLLPENLSERLYTVGRLDYRSSGLILFTNDGLFSSAISHPGRGIEKEYLVESTGLIPDEFIHCFLQGIAIEGVHYKAEAVERLGKRTLRIVLIEGKNREIRKIFSYFHLHPKELIRVRIGPVQLGGLEVGKSRPLTKDELKKLMERA